MHEEQMGGGARFRPVCPAWLAGLLHWAVPEPGRTLAWVAALPIGRCTHPLDFDIPPRRRLGEKRHIDRLGSMPKDAQGHAEGVNRTADWLHWLAG